MNLGNEFMNYATKHHRMSSMHLEKYMQDAIPNVTGFTPHVIEERQMNVVGMDAVSYTHLRAHETVLDLVCRLLLEYKKTPLATASLCALSDPQRRTPR